MQNDLKYNDLGREEPNPFTLSPLFSFSVSLRQIREWKNLWLDYRRKKRIERHAKYEWIYKHCECKGFFNSAPNCPTHFNRLVRWRIKPITEAEFYKSMDNEKETG